ncbi:MAG: deoxyribodipyrimidine photo-lyase [Planctomycetota bacterium]
MSTKIDERRVKRLNDLEAVSDNDFVLYWMQQSQRAEHNDALEFSIQQANQFNVPLVVAFALWEEDPGVNPRQCWFMLEGIQQTANQLSRRGILFVVRLGEPCSVVLKLARRACMIVCDRAYLRDPINQRNQIAQDAECQVWQIESNAIVPVETASEKQEYAARTIRKQINSLASDLYQSLQTTALENSSLGSSIRGEDISRVEDLIKKLNLGFNQQRSREFIGGTSQAKARLGSFLSDRLGRYDERTSINDPAVSYLSPYLHFGQISPVEVALKVQSKRGQTRESKAGFLEELLVRRELGINFVHYCPEYDSLNCLPDWAAETLDQHETDDRPHHYTATELEAAETHDPAWNAMMTEMKKRGYIHNHLRMYWGKKIIEWTNTVNHAYRTALALNNQYFIDGHDCNSYCNVAWLFGLHDRAHAEREVFGKVRYMSADGLKRKLDVDGYVAAIQKQYSEEKLQTNEEEMQTN